MSSPDRSRSPPQKQKTDDDAPVRRDSRPENIIHSQARLRIARIPSSSPDSRPKSLPGSRSLGNRFSASVSVSECSSPTPSLSSSPRTSFSGFMSPRGITRMRSDTFSKVPTTADLVGCSAAGHLVIRTQPLQMDPIVFDMVFLGLRSLSIQGCPFKFHLDQAQFPALEDLAVGSIEFKDISFNLASLQSLFLQDISITGDRGANLAESLNRSPLLRRVVLETVSGTVPDSWKLDLPNVRHLDLRGVDIKHLDLFAPNVEFLDLRASHLQNFTIAPSVARDNRERFSAFLLILNEEVSSSVQKIVSTHDRVRSIWWTKS